MADELSKTKGAYNPSQETLDVMRKDRKKIDRMYDYRRNFEEQWEANIQKWNQVAPPAAENTPNYVVPVARMATNAGIIKMRQALPSIRIVPEGKEEKRMSILLGDASSHIHRMTNIESVMDHAMVDFSVIGNTVLESFVKVPYTTRRIPVIDKSSKKTGRYKTVYKRDWSRPKIGTRFRSIWECAFDEGARSVAEIRKCTFQDRLTLEEFKEQYVNRPNNEYRDTQYVEAGKIYTFVENNELEREDANHKKVVIDHVQDELEDSYRIYANGVLIWDVALSEVHEHGKCTLSLIANHHRYDRNFRTHALYGTGDPELIEDLDDLINAATNMYIRNMQLKNTYLIGVEGALDVDDIDYVSGQPFRGKINVQSLGQADLPEWNAFKDICEEWAIQIVQKNYKRLEGETAKTAYESRQKKLQEDQGIEYQAKKMESSGLYEYYKKHVSDIMEHLPIEEWEEITDEDKETIKEMIGVELAESDVVFDESGKPVKVRYIERIQTRGVVWKEKIVNGKRSLEDLQEDAVGQDGWLPAAKEYLHTRGWKLFKRVPDIYLVGKTMLGQDDVIELAKIEQFLGIVSNVANLVGSGIDIGIDPNKLIEKAAEAIDIDMQELKTGTDDEDMKQQEDMLAQAKALLPQFRNVPQQTPNTVAAQAGGQPPQSPQQPV